MKQILLIVAFIMLFLGVEGIYASQVDARAGYVSQIDVSYYPTTDKWEYIELLAPSEYSVVFASTSNSLPTNLQPITSKEIDIKLGFRGSYDRAEKLFTSSFLFDEKESIGVEIEHTSTGVFESKGQLVFVSRNKSMIIPKTEELNFYYLI